MARAKAFAVAFLGSSMTCSVGGTPTSPSLTGPVPASVSGRSARCPCKSDRGQPGLRDAGHTAKRPESEEHLHLQRGGKACPPSARHCLASRRMCSDEGTMELQQAPCSLQLLQRVPPGEHAVSPSHAAAENYGAGRQLCAASGAACPQESHLRPTPSNAQMTEGVPRGERSPT